MPDRLLVVEEVFAVTPRGVQLAPRFVPKDAGRRAFEVRLVLPGGEERRVRAELQIAHVRGPLAPFALLRLPELSSDDVPPGTEVWSVE